MSTFDQNPVADLERPEKHADKTPEEQFLHDLSFELWLSGYQSALVPDHYGNSDLIRKLHYLSGFASFQSDWHGVYTDVMRMVEDQQRTVKIPCDVSLEQVSDMLNKSGMSFTITDKNEVIINPFADIHDDLLGVLTGMKHQVDNLGDFSNKLQDKLVSLIDKTANSDISYKSNLQKSINNIVA